MEQIKKSAQDSKTIQSYIIMPQHLNGGGKLFGGQLMAWIDMTAGIVAFRHTDSNVLTACVDHLSFKDSAQATDIVTLVGEVTYTGRTSMEIRVDSFKENKGGKKILINRAYLVLVAIDDDTGKPKEIPQLLIETEEQQKEWLDAIERNKIRKERK